MSKYHLVDVSLSEAQARRLVDNKPVLLKLQHVAGGALDGHSRVKMCLTGTQAKKFAAAHQAGRGMRVLFSKGQARHHAMRMPEIEGGRAWWKRMFSFVHKKILKPVGRVLKPFIRPIAKAAIELVPGLPQAIDLGKQAIEALPGGKNVTGAVDSAITKAVGQGMRSGKSAGEIGKAASRAAGRVMKPKVAKAAAALGAAAKVARKPRVSKDKSGGALAPMGCAE